MAIAVDPEDPPEKEIRSRRRLHEDPVKPSARNWRSRPTRSNAPSQAATSSMSSPRARLLAAAGLSAAQTLKVGAARSLKTVCAAGSRHVGPGSRVPDYFRRPGASSGADCRGQVPAPTITAYTAHAAMQMQDVSGPVTEMRLRTASR